MWPTMAQGIGTFYFENFPNFLDQFMVSKGIAIGSKISVTDSSVQIITFP